MLKGNLITMESRATSTAGFIIHRPIHSALPLIRRAIRDDQLAIAGEIDSAQRVKRALEIYVPPCRILLIDNPAFTLETTAIDRSSGTLIPLHLVVSAAGNHTLVHMLNVEHIRQSNLPIGIRAPVLDLQRQVIRALARIAERIRSQDLLDRSEHVPTTDGPEAA
jgi:uncharacterized protein (DUF302 family)